MTDAVIYGCGINAIRLYHEIEDYSIIAFVDKSYKKQGYVVDGIKCIPFEKLLEMDRSISVIVSIEKPDLVIMEISKLGFLNVSSGKELNRKAKKREFIYEEIRDLKHLLEKGLDNDQLDLQEKCVCARLIRDYRIRKKNEYC